MDDIDGQCGDGSYPLLNTMAQIFDFHRNKRTRMKIVLFQIIVIYLIFHLF